MIRRVGFVTMLVAALLISACGRQVTPSRGGIGGLSPGFMSVKFRVASGFNFQSNSYVVVFNTSNQSSTGTVTPVAEAANNNYAGYSFAIVVGGQNGSVGAQAYYYYRPCNTSQPPVLYPINTVPQQLIFTPNSNGQGTEFTVVFDRAIANFSLVGSTATPSASPTGSASPSSSPSPTAAPSVVASGGCVVPVTQYWTYNFFTVAGYPTQFISAGSLTILDSLGQQGPTDATYQSTVLDTTTAFDQTFLTMVGTHPQTSDAITGGEIVNNP